MTGRRTILGAALALPALRAAAQEGVTRIQVGFAAGGGTDVMTRLLAERVRAAGGPGAVVVNRGGASGRFAVDALRAGPADGTTLMIAPFGVPVMNPALFPGTGQESGADYLPVSRLATTEFALAVTAGHPARDVPELTAWLRANRDRAAFGTAVLGNLPHFLGLAFGAAIGVPTEAVGYRGGGPMVTDLVGGQIGMAFSVDADFADMARAGRLRILATAGDTPSLVAPEAPTFASLGLPLRATGWNGLFAPLGTPTPVIARIAADWGAAVRDPATAERLRGMGLRPTGEGPDAFARIIAADAARWRPVIEASGFRAT